MKLGLALHVCRKTAIPSDVHLWEMTPSLASHTLRRETLLLSVKGVACILGVTPHKGDSFNGRFSEPLPFAFVFEACTATELSWELQIRVLYVCRT